MAFLVGTCQFCSHSIGGIAFTGARQLYVAAPNAKVMTVTREHIAVVGGQRWMGVGFTGHQGDGMDAGAVGLVAVLDAAKIDFGTFLFFLGSIITITRA
jgi:hypothetical protein